MENRSKSRIYLVSFSFTGFQSIQLNTVLGWFRTYFTNCGVFRTFGKTLNRVGGGDKKHEMSDSLLFLPLANQVAGKVTFSRATWEAQFPFQFKFQLYDELWIGSILKICRFLIRHIIPSRILPILNSAYFYRRNRQYSTRYDMPN